ncbi:MAG: hypothetical protein IKN72_07355 [Clostridia bacterium]|nr:hypothetical protein [Clostridia bacterium]
MKRILALLLAVVLCCALCACGKKDDAPKTENNAAAAVSNTNVGRLADENGSVCLICAENGYILQFTDATHFQNLADWDGMNDFVDLNPDSYDHCEPFTVEVPDDTHLSQKYGNGEACYTWTLAYTDPDQNYLVYQADETTSEPYDSDHYMIITTGPFLQNYAKAVQKAFADEPLTGEIDPMFEAAMNSFDGLIAFLDSCRA